MTGDILYVTPFFVTPSIQYENYLIDQLRTTFETRGYTLTQRI